MKNSNARDCLHSQLLYITHEGNGRTHQTCMNRFSGTCVLSYHAHTSAEGKNTTPQQGCFPSSSMLFLVLHATRTCCGHLLHAAAHRQGMQGRAAGRQHAHPLYSRVPFLPSM